MHHRFKAEHQVSTWLTMATYDSCVDVSHGEWDEAAGARSWLRPSERIKWRGGPDPTTHLAPEDLFLIPFTILWAGFAIFWESSVIKTGWTFGAFWGIPFVAIGLYLVVGRFFYKEWDRRRTRYAITDQRVVIIRNAGQTVQSGALGEPNEIKRRRDGTHATFVWSIPGDPSVRRGLFSTGAFPFDLGGAGWPMSSRYGGGALRFYDLTDPDQALNALRTDPGGP
jgi:hypothetical protein